VHAFTKISSDLIASAAIIVQEFCAHPVFAEVRFGSYFSVTGPSVVSCAHGHLRELTIPIKLRFNPTNSHLTTTILQVYAGSTSGKWHVT
jgi:hypothetical protein